MAFTDVVRKSALPAIWSQGVTLARGGAALLVSRTPREITGRVRGTDALAAPEVTLYLEDEEWSCTCPSRVDPCPHVVALALAVDQGLVGDARAEARSGAPIARTDSPAAPRAGRALQLRYSFSRSRGTLYLERHVGWPDGREEPLVGSLLKLTRTGGPELLPTAADLTVDRIAGGFRQGIVPTARVREILGLLEGADRVDLDGHPVRTSRDEVLPVARVTDHVDGGVVVTISEDPGVSEVVACGVVRRGDELAPMGGVDLTGEQREKLPVTRVVSKGELGSFALEILPQLEAKAIVVVDTRRLPSKMGRTVPRLSFDMKQEGATLGVLPSLVYGDPAVARIDGDLMVSLGAAIPPREREKERALVDRLRAELDLVVGRRAFFKGDDAARFLSRLVSFSGQDVHNARIGGTRLVPRVVIGHDLRLDVTLSAEDEPEVGASAEAVLSAWRQGLSFVPLEGGGFAPLPADWLDRYGERVLDLLAARREDGTIPRQLARELASLADDLDLPPPPVPDDLARHAKGLDGLPDAVLPPDLAVELRPYQLDGVRFLQFSRRAGLGAILADDMGLGKTAQLLAALPARGTGGGQTLVVCPRSVLFNWEREIARFRPGLRSSRYHGSDRELDPGVDVILTTYGTLRRDLEPLGKVHFACVVLDEAQAIKNPSSQSARVACALDADLRVALTGTPIENRLLELYSLVHFTNPWMLGRQNDFVRRYEDPIAAGDPDATRRLREKTRPILLRRTKQEVAPELPPRTESVLFVDLEKDERDIYDAVRAAARVDIVRRLGQGLSPMMALEALLRLRQAACHPSLLPGQSRPTSSKLDRLIHALGDAVGEGHKALVFSQWTRLLDLVEPALAAAGLPFVRLDGQTVDREAVVDAFQSAAGPPVMIVSLKAGGTGLNLTAADHVFLLDPWWNPAVEDQAADRTHRIGQDKPVFVYRLVAKDTVEERVLALAERKRSLLGTVVPDGTAAVRITEADLLALLDG